MTPDEARALLDGTTPGPWKWRWDTGLLSIFGAKGESVATDLEVQDSDLTAAAPTLAAMIAGMREEWGVKWDDDPNGPPDWGFPTRAAAEQWAKKNRHYGPERGRIVRRYVTEPEAVE